MSPTLTIGGVDVLIPIDEDKPPEHMPAPRLATLHGKVLGFLDNTKENLAALFDIIQRELARQYALKEVIRRQKAHYAMRAPLSLLEELAKTCDAVIVGVGS
ncbi:MAG: hypothetical protein HYZ81_01965 [Nitrospinae bacterium]|nr:hypothetical protein [Nitrospinota bacterium]